MIDRTHALPITRQAAALGVYLHAYDSVSAATAGIARYLTLYNTRRPHSSLADRTPDAAYFLPLSRPAAACPPRRSS